MLHPESLFYNSIQFVTTVFAVCLLLPPAIKVTPEVINSAMLSPHILHICHHNEHPCVVCLWGVDLTNFSAQLHKDLFSCQLVFFICCTDDGKEGQSGTDWGWCPVWISFRSGCSSRDIKFDRLAFIVHAVHVVCSFLSCIKLASASVVISVDLKSGNSFT